MVPRAVQWWESKKFFEAQYAGENSTKRSKDKKLLYTGLTGILNGFQKHFFQNPKNFGKESTR